MYNQNYITIKAGKKELRLETNQIIYVAKARNLSKIHMMDNTVHEVYMSLNDLMEELGEGFLLVNRGLLVAAMAIYNIDDQIHLINGESLDYVVRKRKEIEEQLYERQKKVIRGFHEKNPFRTKEDYHDHYRCFDELPFAFADIEMVFDEENRAVDWIFRYGNPALAKLEKVPLEQLLDCTFGSVFTNKDPKWVKRYERAALFGEKLEIIDYSPEIDTYLDIICFPTFQGHCGCILFDISEIKFLERTDSEKALGLYFGKMMGMATSFQD